MKPRISSGKTASEKYLLSMQVQAVILNNIDFLLRMHEPQDIVANIANKISKSSTCELVDYIDNSIYDDWLFDPHRFARTMTILCARLFSAETEESRGVTS
jgi:hypothetical protein